MNKELRLDKFLADMGKGTRSALKEAVRKGRVRVNGEVIKKADIKVRIPGDTVTLDGEEVAYAVMEYYMLNKPQGVVSATEDKKYPTVLDLIADKKRKDLFPVGRLDYNTSGMLILTNDGDLTYRLTHPRHQVTKTYRALVSGVLSKEKLFRLRKGVDIGGFVTSPAQVKIIRQAERSAVVDITIHEGKNRQVRKMFAAVGNPVQELQRTAIGDLRLGRLKEGHYRKLTRNEIEYLKNL